MITEEEKLAIAAQIGKKPWEFDLSETASGDLQVTPRAADATNDRGALMTGGKYALGNAPGTILGAQTGSIASKLAGPGIDVVAKMAGRIPRVGPLAEPLVKFLGRAGVFGATAAGTKNLAESLPGVGTVKDYVVGSPAQQERDRSEHPYAVPVGEFSANLAAQRLPDIKSLASGAAKAATLRRLATADMGLTAKESAALANAAGGGALGLATEGIQQVREGDLDVGDLALNTVAGGLLGDVRKLGRRPALPIPNGLKPPVSAPEPVVDPLAEQLGSQTAAQRAAKAEAEALGAQLRTGQVKLGDIGQRINQNPLLRGYEDIILAQEPAASYEEQPVPNPLVREMADPRAARQRASVEADALAAKLATGKATLGDIGRAMKQNPLLKEFESKFTQGSIDNFSNEILNAAGNPMTASPIQAVGDLIRRLNATKWNRPTVPTDAPVEATVEGRQVEIGSDVTRPEVRAGETRKYRAPALEPGRTDEELLQDRLENTGAKYQPADEPTLGAPDPRGLAKLTRRGVDYEVTDEALNEGKASGEFNPQTAKVRISATQARPTTAEHEGMHAELQDMLLSGNPKLAKLATELLAVSGEEPLAEGGAVASQAGDKQNRLMRLISDNWAYLASRWGAKTPERAAKILAERFDFQAPGEIATPSSGEGPKFQPRAQSNDEIVPGAVYDTGDTEVSKELYAGETTRDRLLGEYFNAPTVALLRAIRKPVITSMITKRSRAFDSGQAPQYTPEEQQADNMFGAIMDNAASLAGQFGHTIRKLLNYVPHMVDPALARTSEQDYAAFEAEFLPQFLEYNATQYKPATASAPFDPADATKYFREYFQGVGRAPNTAFGTDFGVLSKRARQYGLPENMREADPIRLLDRFGDRFVRHLVEEQVRSNPRASAAMGFDEGIPAESARMVNARSAMSGQLPNQGRVTSALREGFDATRALVNASVMQTPTALRNTLQKIPTYAVAAELDPVNGTKAIVEGIGSTVSDFSTQLDKALKANVVRLGRDYTDVSDNLNTGGKVAKGLRDAGRTMQKLTGAAYIEAFNRVMDYSVGEAYARTGNQEFWNRYGAGVDDTMPMEEQVARAARNFVIATQSSYGPEGLPEWLLRSGNRALVMRIQRFGWENMRRVQKDVLRPLTQGNVAPLLTYLLGAGATAAMVTKLNEAIMRKPSSLPTAREIDITGNSQAVEQTLNIMQLAEAASAFGVIGSAASSVAGNVRGQSRALVGDPTINFAMGLVDNVAQSWDAIGRGEPVVPVITTALERTIKGSMQNLRALDVDPDQAKDVRDKQTFDYLTERSPATSASVAKGLILGNIGQPGRKISPTAVAAAEGDMEARRRLAPAERARIDNYPGGYEDPEAETWRQRFTLAAEGPEALEGYRQRRERFRRRAHGKP